MTAPPVHQQIEQADCEGQFHFTAQLESNEACVTFVKLTVTVAAALQLRGLDPALGPAGIWHRSARP
jgi:hypothetical protein